MKESNKMNYSIQITRGDTTSYLPIWADTLEDAKEILGKYLASMPNGVSGDIRLGVN